MEKKTTEEKDRKPKNQINQETAIFLASEKLTADAQSIFDIALRWELGDGASDENPAIKVAEEMLRQVRALRMQHYRNNHAGVSAVASGVFALPPAIRQIFRNVPKDEEK